MKKSILIAILAIAGCKQGKGERCQVEADCQDGLVCNQATNTCQTGLGGGIDATVPDAPPGDAAPGDTPLD